MVSPVILSPFPYIITNETVFLVFNMFRETTEDPDSQGDASSQPDTISIASRTSQNTVDSDKVGPKLYLMSNILCDSLESSAMIKV